MRVVDFIDCNNVVKLDAYPLCEQTLDLANKLKNGELSINDLPPIHTKLENGTHVILDGRHRYTAIKLAGINKIKSRFYKK